ncbi:MAG: hypothetical protein IJQ81_08870 [Oscillibacter sp.]|nr:hypothetical protein [Oscillibacter sp.]
MYPLIEIKSVPIELQFKTKSASLEYTRGTAEMEISRSEQGGVNVKSRPIQVKLDTFEQRGGQFSAANAAVAQATQAQYQATSAYADQGQIQLNARIGNSAPQAQSGEGAYTPDLQPTSGVNVKWEDGAMKIRYAMDKLNFDWKIDQGEFKFTPGDIEISVAQKPSLTIKYTGGPIYVPRSADPNYQPVDVNA